MKTGNKIIYKSNPKELIYKEIFFRVFCKDEQIIQILKKEFENIKDLVYEEVEALMKHNYKKKFHKSKTD